MPEGFENHLKNIEVTNFKEQDRKLILEFLKGKAEVHVSDLIAYSGAEKMRVYPILFEEVQAGYIMVTKANFLGTPEIIALSNNSWLIFH